MLTLSLHNELFTMYVSLEHASCWVTKFPVIIKIIVIDRLELVPTYFV